MGAGVRETAEAKARLVVSSRLFIHKLNKQRIAAVLVQGYWKQNNWKLP